MTPVILENSTLETFQKNHPTFIYGAISNKKISINYVKIYNDFMIFESIYKNTYIENGDSGAPVYEYVNGGVQIIGILKGAAYKDNQEYYIVTPSYNVGGVNAQSIIK